MLGAVLLGPEQIEIRELPVESPGRGEALVQIRAATTCGTDVKVYRRGGHPRMLQVPTLFGHEMSGVIAALGEGVVGLKTGDAVVVSNSAACGACDPCRSARENLCEDLHYLNGGFAEYLLVPERFVPTSLYPLPSALSFERAALCEPLACVLHGIECCRLSTPFEIAVYGAGPIGLLFTAALAMDGHRVLLADPNRARLEVGHQLGASETVQVTRGGGQHERVKAVAGAGHRGVDVSIDCTGVPEVWADAVESVRPGGLALLFGGCAPGTTMSVDTHRLHYSELTIRGAYHHRPKTFQRAIETLTDEDFAADRLLSAEYPIAAVEVALRSMMSKEILKAVIRGR